MAAAGALESLTGAAAIVALIAGLAWISRTTENVPALGGGTPKQSPRWAMAWWFVPIAWFWMPYRVLTEIDARLRNPAPGTRLLPLFWASWVAALFAGAASNYAARGPSTAGGVRTLFLAGAVAGGLFGAALVLATAVIRRLERLSRTRAADPRVTRPAGLPALASWTAGQLAVGGTQSPTYAETRAGMLDPSAASQTLRELADLHAQGIITAEEFAAKKTELLGRM